MRRDAAGKDQVRMVLRKQHKVLDIDEANYGNVGYNGSWAATYGIADPRQLQRMQPDGAPAQGVQRYRQARGESQVLIDWDIQGQYARRIEIQGPHGLSVSKVTVTDAARAVPRALDPAERLRNGRLLRPAGLACPRAGLNPRARRP
ncbi:hypothetical protein WJ968_14680 [Achromobacter xylosoxidans]